MIDYGSVCSGIENADERPDLRCGCGYEFADELGEYGCPNCEGDEGPAKHITDGQLLVMARVYIAQARATPWPEFRSTLIRWARRRLHRHIRSTKRGQMEIQL